MFNKEPNLGNIYGIMASKQKSAISLISLIPKQFIKSSSRILSAGIYSYHHGHDDEDDKEIDAKDCEPQSDRYVQWIWRVGACVAAHQLMTPVMIDNSRKTIVLPPTPIQSP